MTQKFVVNFVTGQGGSGHYATHLALEAAIRQQNLPWEIQVTDMDEMITELSQSGKVKNVYETFGFSGHALYNLMVKKGWTWLWPLKMRLNKLLVALNYDIGVETFAAHWREQQPDLVVSCMPLYNKGLQASLQRARPGARYITVLTDFADCPPAFWFDPETDGQWVCGTQRAAKQARDLGIAESRIVRSSGLVIHPRFYNARTLPAAASAAKRQQLGLAPDRPTGIVMFGGNGSQLMLKIAWQLEKLGSAVQLIFICGHNRALLERLNAYRGPQKRAVVGFTRQVAHYMRLSDFFIGKPGNVSVSEALAMKLPVITACNFATMSQERYCAEWVAAQEVGIVMPAFSRTGSAISQLLRPGELQRYRANLEKYDNRAVFEVVDFLQKSLCESHSLTARHRLPNVYSA